MTLVVCCSRRLSKHMFSLSLWVWVYISGTITNANNTATPFLHMTSASVGLGTPVANSDPASNRHGSFFLKRLHLSSMYKRHIVVYLSCIIEHSPVQINVHINISCWLIYREKFLFCRFLFTPSTGTVLSREESGDCRTILFWDEFVYIYRKRGKGFGVTFDS